MSKIQKIKIILIACLLLFVAVPALAAEIFFDTKTQEIGVNQQFQVDLILDTENEEVNALDGKIIFSQDILELKEIRDGDSIINFWVERPRKTEEVVFSGIIPGGYMGKEGLIFSAIFQSKEQGEGVIEIREAKALFNDGKGTEVPLTISNFQFLISKQIPISQIPMPEIKDTEPPESFAPQIAADPAIFEGKWFLVFATQDKGSGVDGYEVLESRSQKIENRSWETAESPYVLEDQELRSYVFVKAVDKASNERIVVVPPRHPLNWYEEWENWSIILLGFVVIYVVIRFLWKKRRKQKF